jgi:Tfp pilus assembly major pilin PilA
MSGAENLISTLIAIGILSVLGYLIFQKVKKRNPEMAEKMSSVFKEKEPKIEAIKEVKITNVNTEKRFNL